MIVKNFFIAASITACTFVNAQTVSYFDENWEVTTKENMTYYREATKQGQLTLIKDFYKSGVLQMEGLAIVDNVSAEVWDGKVTWYFENGKVESVKNYKNGTLQGEIKSYDADGRIIEDLIYKEDHTFSGKMMSYKEGGYYTNNSITEYAIDGTTNTLVYDEDPKGIRYETYINPKGDTESKFYGDKGKFIGSRIYKYDNYKGVNVDYYENPMQVKKVVEYDAKGVEISYKAYQRNGAVLQDYKINKKDGYKKTYNKEGKLIGNLVLKFQKENDGIYPFEGDDYNFDYEFDKITNIDVYKNYKLIISKIFNEEGNLSSETFMDDYNINKIVSYNKEGLVNATLNYKDGMPYEGFYKDSSREEVYSDGVLQRQKVFGEAEVVIKESVYNKDLDNYNVTQFDQEGAKTMVVNNYSTTDGFLSGEIAQYKNGKITNTATVVSGIVTKGKVSYLSNDIKTDMQRSGDWILVKKYTPEGKLFLESKISVVAMDELTYYESSVYLQVDDILNLY